VRWLHGVALSLRKWHFVYQFATELSMRSSGGPPYLSLSLTSASASVSAPIAARAAV
jgi:hypothetical protein